MTEKNTDKDIYKFKIIKVRKYFDNMEYYPFYDDTTHNIGTLDSKNTIFDFILNPTSTKQMDYVVFTNQQIYSSFFNIVNSSSYSSIVYKNDPSINYNMAIRVKIPIINTFIQLEGNILVNKKIVAKSIFTQKEKNTFFFRLYNKILLNKNDVIDFETVTCNYAGIDYPPGYIGNFSLYT
jgi:hypothetical protein